MTNGNGHSNGTFETVDIDFASYLYAMEVQFLRLNWANPERAAFVFKTPPDEVLAAWIRDYQDLIRKMKYARNFLRDTVEGKR